MMNDTKRENRQMIENLREEMLSNYRGMDQKFSEGQSSSAKQS